MKIPGKEKSGWDFWTEVFLRFQKHFSMPPKLAYEAFFIDALFYLLGDPLEILSWTKWFSFQAMLNATVSVDSFFLLRLVSDYKHPLIVMIYFNSFVTEVHII